MATNNGGSKNSYSKDDLMSGNLDYNIAVEKSPV